MVVIKLTVKLYMRGLDISVSRARFKCQWNSILLRNQSFNEVLHHLLEELNWMGLHWFHANLLENAVIE